MFSLKGYREPTHRLPDWLPWYGLVAPGVVLQKNEVLQKTVAFRGPDLMASGRPELTATVFRLNNALKRLSSGWAIFVEAQRFETDNYPSSTWPHPASWIVDYERRHNFRGGTHLETSYYLTFAWQLPTLVEHRAARLFSGGRAGQRPRAVGGRRGRPRRSARPRHLREDRAGDSRHHGGRLRRGARAVRRGDAHLSPQHISTNRHRVRMPEVPAYLDALLPDQAFTPGDIPMLGRHYVPACTITGFPGSTVPGILDQLNHLGIEYRWSTRYILLARKRRSASSRRRAAASGKAARACSRCSRRRSRRRSRRCRQRLGRQGR